MRPRPSQRTERAASGEPPIAVVWLVAVFELTARGALAGRRFVGREAVPRVRGAMAEVRRTWPAGWPVVKEHVTRTAVTTRTEVAAWARQRVAAGPPNLTRPATAFGVAV